MSDYSKEAMFKEYQRLTGLRDAKLSEVKHLSDALAAANTKMEAARVEAVAVAAKIGEAKGGQEWLDLKKTIAVLARALHGKDGPLASK